MKTQAAREIILKSILQWVGLERSEARRRILQKILNAYDSLTRLLSKMVTYARQLIAFRRQMHWLMMNCKIAWLLLLQQPFEPHYSVGQAYRSVAAPMWWFLYTGANVNGYQMTQLSWWMMGNELAFFTRRSDSLSGAEVKRKFFFWKLNTTNNAPSLLANNFFSFVSSCVFFCTNTNTHTKSTLPLAGREACFVLR